MAIGPVVVASGTGDVQAVSGTKYNLRLVGFSVAETAGTAATAEVVLRHGTAATDDPLVAPINLAADGFGTFWYPPGIPCPNGIYVDRVSGTTTLVLYVDRV